MGALCVSGDEEGLFPEILPASRKESRKESGWDGRFTLNLQAVCGVGHQHFHSILVSRIRACHEEMLQVLAEAEYMWLLSLAAPSRGCGAELESIRTCGCAVTNSLCPEVMVP